VMDIRKVRGKPGWDNAVQIGVILLARYGPWICACSDRNHRSSRFDSDLGHHLFEQ
jgi:hypothetical protein